VVSDRRGRKQGEPYDCPSLLPFRELPGHRAERSTSCRAWRTPVLGSRAKNLSRLGW